MSRSRPPRDAPESTDDPTALPRPEYPRPQFQRDAWLNLNGTWTFAFDPDGTGRERGFPASRGFEREITVPFCPESALSGVAHTGFIPAIWYHRRLRVPASWAGQRVHLHFGGVDYEARVYLDGREVGFHYGGSSSWKVDLTDAVEFGGEHQLVVLARDDLRSRRQPAGKQSREPFSHGCYYTRVTGIWQTVWLEPVPPGGLERVHIVPDLDGHRFLVTPTFASLARGRTFRATLLADGETLHSRTVPALQQAGCELPVATPRPWSPDDPFLYDLRLEVLDARGAPLDRVRAYAGLRKIHLEGDRVFLNDRPLYQRLVLDQGYYPDGIWTAPSDAALVRDIELALEAGFNGARLHQRAFEERFHYHADRLGYLTWAESASWGLDENDPAAARNFLAEWRELVERDRNHPSILAWTPLNETEFHTVSDEHRRFVADAYELTRALDPSRPVNDASGWVHVRTDLWTVHLYTQDPEELARQLSGEVFRNQPEHEPAYAGQPYLVDEFGGIKWAPDVPRVDDAQREAWGYGADPTTLEAFHARLEALVDAVLASPRVVGYCYTQLTDVEQERNGLYTYDREPKFDLERIRRVFARDPVALPGDR